MELKNKSIDLFGTIYKIKIVDNIKIEGSNGTEYPLGLTDSVNHIISIASYVEDTKVPKNEMELTLLHELVHAIFITGQYFEENENEPLVEWTARCLNQLIKKNIL